MVKTKAKKGMEQALCFYNSETKMIYLIGGINMNTEQKFRINIIDYQKKEFINVKSEDAIKPRVGHAGILKNNTFIYIFGGFVCNEGYVMDCMKFSLVTHKWLSLEMESPQKVVPLGRVGHSLTEFKESVIMIGGSRDGLILDDIWLINLEQLTWEPLKYSNPFFPPLFAHKAFLIPQSHLKDSIIIFGGYTQDQDDVNQLQNPTLQHYGNHRIFIIDIHKNIIGNDKYVVYLKNLDVLGNLHPRSFFDVVIQKNGDFFIFGGSVHQNVAVIKINDQYQDYNQNFIEFLSIFQVKEKMKKKVQEIENEGKQIKEKEKSNIDILCEAIIKIYSEQKQILQKQPDNQDNLEVKKVDQKSNKTKVIDKQINKQVDKQTSKVAEKQTISKQIKIKVEEDISDDRTSNNSKNSKNDKKKEMDKNNNTIYKSQKSKNKKTSSVSNNKQNYQKYEDDDLISRGSANSYNSQNKSDRDLKKQKKTIDDQFNDLELDYQDELLTENSKIDSKKKTKTTDKKNDAKENYWQSIKKGKQL